MLAVTGRLRAITYFDLLCLSFNGLSRETVCKKDWCCCIAESGLTGRCRRSTEYSGSKRLAAYVYTYLNTAPRANLPSLLFKHAQMYVMLLCSGIYCSKSRSSTYLTLPRNTVFYLRRLLCTYLRDGNSSIHL